MASLRKVLPCLVLSCLVFILLAEAREFPVGGNANSWKIPSSPDAFNKWAEKERFEIGDSLVMKYDPKSDSVLEVTEEDYKNCNKGKPIKSYKGGETKIALNRSGLFYFISGAEGHCEKGQKLEVDVLSDKHEGGGVKGHPPALAPVSVLPPAPAPAPADGAHALTVGFMATVLAVGVALL
ncbi:hypothetical protein RJ640_000649 [Escallonia rubra]|uniref:Phytocyanin domain-containing protein n=1 Tax=Escallonia rubra TaxID=112253 RepID=A0AA88QI50_9ASTE|nr:hypothetical protein RJ640_000649 [Escallonia rubra]